MELTSPRAGLGEGIPLPAGVIGVVDVLVAGRRVWSFNPQRDADTHGFVAWPPGLAERVRGRLEWQLVDHATGEVHGTGSAQVGDSDELCDLLDEHGHPLAVNKGGGALERVFDDSDAHRRRSIVDGVVNVLHDLRGPGGAEAFLAFGCLLGAVRDGRLIGHDTDADVVVLCPGTAPVDVLLQSYRLEHLMLRRGWSTTRMSGGGFKVHVDAGDGSALGVDVFSAWYDEDETLHVLPHVSGRLPRDAVLPVGTVTLEGREVVAPGDPEALLALTYGASWAVPDPSFTYAVDPLVRRRMSAWFRGERRMLRTWDRRHAEESAEPPRGPSAFASWVAPQLTGGARLLDLGCGAGSDCVEFAGRGIAVTGYDYSPLARTRTSEAARAAGVSVSVGSLNLQDSRDMLTAGAQLALARGAVDVYCRHVLELLDSTDRAMFWRFCSMVHRCGGRTFVETRLGREGQRALDRLVLDAEAAGGVVEHASAGAGRAEASGDDPLVGRIVISWTGTGNVT